VTVEPVDTIVPGTLADTPKRKPYTVERARFPLVWKLFGLTALVILIVAGVAVGITIERADKIARRTIDASISSAAKLFRDFEHQRLERLTGAAELLGHDPVFASFVQDSLHPGAAALPASTVAAAPVQVEPVAPAGVDYASLADQLPTRAEGLGADLMVLLDDTGRVIFRTDEPTLSGGSRPIESPMIHHLVDDASVPSVAGVMSASDKLYHVAIAPVGAGSNNVRVGYIIIGYAMNDRFANRIAESTNAGVMFISRGGSLVRSTNAPSFSMQQMSGAQQVVKSGTVLPPSRVKIDSASYIVTGEPLQSEKETLGAAMFVRSLDSELAPFREIENALLAGGGASLLLAFLLSWLIAKRVTRPIEELAGIAQAVTAGDYTVHPEINRSDEVGILGRSFEKMITALRDKSEIEELYEQMAAKSEEREAISVRVAEPPALEEGTILVTDLRGLPATVGEGDAASVIGVISRTMKMQEAEVLRQDGVVREVAGHRMVSVFRGERGIIHAIRAARAINEELGTGGSKMSLGVGIATGEFVTGSIDVGDEHGLAIVGNAPLLALLFAWHAPTGFAYVSHESAQAAGGEILASAQREEVRLKWLPQPLPVAALPLVNLTTGVMRSLNSPLDSAATVRLDSTTPGPTAPQLPQQDLIAGSTFANRYRVDQILGRGGMGVVYKATDAQLDEVVAIKTLPGDVMSRSPEDLERFKREIRLARKITHRNVLRTYDYGEADGVYFISMEYVRGYTLADLLTEAEGRRMVPRVAMGIARQVSRGLEAAHEQNIIHRDIKPQNVLIDHKGEVKLMDFGIARVAEATEGMTQAGLIVGTPHYMSPEQVQGKPLDPRSDVYSMGVMIYEMLVGEKPFNSSSLTGVLTAHIMEPAKPPIELRPEIGREINAIVMRSLAKDPKVRYKDAGELLVDLDKVKVPA
jgi:HAMP domain-containing protein/predicted Ser/Thr protein kinase